MTSTGLREALLGAWELVSFTSRDVATGRVRQPLGADPCGLLTYTPDGRMSAQLATRDMGDYVSYGGGFSVDDHESTVSHEVTMSSMPELLAAPQVRHVRFDGPRLELSVTTTDEHGAATESTLEWARPR